MLTTGSEVLVRSLNRRGVVVAALRDDVYRVQVGALTVTVRGQELEVPAASKKKPRRPTVESAARHEEQSTETASAPASLDLHGLTVEDARNRVAGYISRAILAGHDRVEIVHGIGTGRLKAAVTKDLRALPVVRAVKPHPSNPGITVVYL